MNSKYQNGKIYCIWSYETEEIYIGSTYNELDHRLKGHKDKYSQMLNGKKVGNRKSFEILKYGDAQIGIIEEYPCNTKQELLRREGELQKQIKCVNKLIAGQTGKEWRDSNRNLINEKSRKKYEAEDIKIKQERHKKNHERNGHKWKNTRKKYSVNNKEKFTKKTECECGGSFTFSNKSTHFKTKRHIKWLEEKKILIADNIEDGEEKKE